MQHKISIEDVAYLNAFERCDIAVDAFHHKEHIKLAYILLVQHDIDNAYLKLKSSLINFLKYNGAPDSKFHETMTRAWLLAVKHFMHVSTPASSAEEFICSNDILSDKDIMFTHYSRDLIGSEEARVEFVKPDLEPIPLHDG